MTLRATVAYPYVDAELVTLALRGKLRLPARARMADWSTLSVEGRRRVRGLHGRSWFEWRATVETLG